MALFYRICFTILVLSGVAVVVTCFILVVTCFILDDETSDEKGKYKVNLVKNCALAVLGAQFLILFLVFCLRVIWFGG